MKPLINTHNISRQFLTPEPKSNILHQTNFNPDNCIFDEQTNFSKEDNCKFPQFTSEKKMFKVINEGKVLTSRNKKSNFQNYNSPEYASLNSYKRIDQRSLSV